MSLNIHNGVPAHQSDATLTETEPVQNTWYTVLDTTSNARLIALVVAVAEANETLEVKITTSTGTLNGAVNATAATNYQASILTTALNADSIALDEKTTNQDKAFVLEDRSLKIEVRKTTAAGAGTLAAKAVYAKY